MILGESETSRALQLVFSDGSLIQIVSSGDLRSTFLHILDEFRHRYLVSYSPRGVTTNRWHRLEVRVRNRRAIVKARPGYLAGS